MQYDSSGQAREKQKKTGNAERQKAFREQGNGEKRRRKNGQALEPETQGACPVRQEEPRGDGYAENSCKSSQHTVERAVAGLEKEHGEREQPPPGKNRFPARKRGICG